MGIIKCEATCDLNDLKVPKPSKEPDMTVGNLNIQELTSIIKTVVVENTLSREDVIEIVDQRLKPIEKCFDVIENDIKNISKKISKCLNHFMLKILKDTNFNNLELIIFIKTFFG
ncbi:hypothetical protein ACJA27_00815 [Mycoplasmopsis lipophila]|uniref:hypothetical protein n=1 Tax=Mycoplasmopsis lipophila TaxID=2117 RepID=UPI0038739CD5